VVLFCSISNYLKTSEKNQGREYREKLPIQIVKDEKTGNSGKKQIKAVASGHDHVVKWYF